MPRLTLQEHAPEGYALVARLDTYTKRRLAPELLGLVKLRASQLNGCAFCVDLHASELEQHAVPTRKIYAVSGWQETPFFTSQERAALALTEQITRIQGGVDEQTWQAATAAFSGPALSDLVLAIGTINLWNRIGVTTRLTPPALAP